MGSYTVASSAGRQVAGMMAYAPELASEAARWTVFIVVDDLAKSLERVVAAGGAVAQSPVEIPGGAEIAVVADPSGAMFALISGGPEPGDPYFSDEPGAVCFAELMTGDLDSAARFYGEVFDWTAESDEGGPVPYTVCNLDGDAVAGMIGRPSEISLDVPDAWSIYFAAESCEATVQRAVELGGSVIVPTTPTPMGPFAVVADPEGAAFQIMEMAASPT